MNRMRFCVVSLSVALWYVLMSGGSAFGQTQTPGQITQFDPNLNVVDSVITQDPSGNIGIGTTTPAAALDLRAGDFNIGAGHLLKGGTLFMHSTGEGNTFLGATAGSNQSEINYGSTGIGSGALFNNITGGLNTATGWFALLMNNHGSRNTATGAQALQNNTTGYSNTAIGAGALFTNSEGVRNTAIGADALDSNRTGLANTAIGVEALFNTTGMGNTAIGVAALWHNGDGTDNTAVGVDADVSRGDLNNATAIGAGAFVNASNKIRLGNDAVTLVETAGGFYTLGPGRGIILRSPNGLTCKQFSIDNAGNFVGTFITCP